MGLARHISHDFRRDCGANAPNGYNLCLKMRSVNTFITIFAVEFTQLTTWKM